jgi:hypothetical protein
VKLFQSHISLMRIIDAVIIITALIFMAAIFNISLRDVSQDFIGDFYILVKRVSFIAALCVVLLIVDKRMHIITRTDIIVVVLLTCLIVIHFVVGGEASLLKIKMAYVYFLLYLSPRILLSQGRIFPGWAMFKLKS